MEENITNANAGMNDGCDYKSGSLPPCAPLVAAFVPMQGENPPRYGSYEALTRGTLFPGLDLPFKNIANKSNPYSGTPLGELMALSFMVKELQLYLDTHPEDEEAFKALKSVIALRQKGQKAYVERYGPISFSDVQYSDKYNWIQDPWPWEYTEMGGEK